MVKIINLQSKWSWFFILNVFAVFYLGCIGSAGEKKEVSETEQMEMPIPPQNKLAPGTAKIEVHLMTMEKDNSHYNCILKVDKVLGYGMSTKPIGKGTEISLQISNDEEDFIKLLSEGTMEQKYELTVEQEQMVDNQLRWRAIKILKLHFEQ